MLLTPYECHERIDYFGLEKPYIAASNLERAWYKRRGILNPETVAQHQISAALLCNNYPPPKGVVLAKRPYKGLDWGGKLKGIGFWLYARSSY